MKLKSKVKKYFKNTKLIAVTMGFFIMTFSLLIFAYIYQYTNKDNIYPGVYINNLYVGNMSPIEAENKIQSKINTFKEEGFKYIYNNQQITILPTILSPNDPDLTHELLNWSPTETINELYSIGRNKSFINNLLYPLILRYNHKTIKANIKLDIAKLTEILQDNFSKLETPATEPKITWSFNKPVIIPGQSGQVINYQQAINKTLENINNFENKKITLSTNDSQPLINTTDITNDTYNKLTNLGKEKPLLVLKTKEQQWKYNFTEYQDYLSFIKKDDKVYINIQPQWLESKLKQIKTIIDKPAQDAKFSIENGRVVEFQQSLDGILLDIPTNISLVQNNFTKNKYINDLIVSIDKAKIQTADVNDLGIQEIIGVGESTFTGSPHNRLTNIKVGAASLNGILIKPNEEFSLIQALLPIDDTNGYVEELVIKGDRTIPEFGGGLCQIGTTAFRGALNSGLKITQRQNHSYRVSYYEPAGTDATIYDPAPDFRFINDTGNYILLQTRTEGDKMIFEFWGTKDGRVATVSEPRIFNITTPPPTKYIDTTELPPGEIKCTEKAHNGASAELDYSVTYADGTKSERTFKSYYRPWQEVCLRGIDPNTTSTTQAINE